MLTIFNPREMLLLDRNLRRVFKFWSVWWCRVKREALPGAHKKQWVSLLDKQKKKKPLSFSNLLPKLCHPNTNKSHVTAAQLSRLPFTRGPGHPLSNRRAAPKRFTKCKGVSDPKSPSLPCSSRRLPRLEPLLAWHNPTSSSCFHAAF